MILYRVADHAHTTHRGGKDMGGMKFLKDWGLGDHCKEALKSWLKESDLDPDKFFSDWYELPDDNVVEARLTEIFKKMVTDSELDSRSKLILLHYYGLGLEPKTMKKLGEGFGVSGTAIGEARCRALRKLRYKEWVQKYELRVGAALCLNDTDIEYFDKSREYLLNELKFQAKNIRALLDKIEHNISLVVTMKEAVASFKPQDPDKLTLEHLGLSKRTCNALRRAGFNTVGELVDASPQVLHRIRNIGKKGVDEVVEKMRCFGLEMKKDEDSKYQIWDKKSGVDEFLTGCFGLEMKKDEDSEYQIWDSKKN